MVYSADFLTFWRVYPRKVKKLSAAQAWQTEQPDLATVLAALAWQKKSHDWTRDNGQYIPHPSTYLNQRRWEDEPAKVAPAQYPRLDGGPKVDSPETLERIWSSWDGKAKEAK